MNYDVIIIGGGPAGMAAAIYTTRKKLKTLVVTVDVGGQALLTNHMENYPGYTELSGPRLMQIFEEQAKNFGAEFIFGKAAMIGKSGDEFDVFLSNNEKYSTKTVIVASGKVPKQLNVAGEEKFIGRGVSTCSTCDAPLFKNKTVAVIGGGNSALDAALLLAKIAKKVYLMHRREQFRGDEVLVDKVKKTKNIEVVLNSVAKEVRGEKFVKSLVIENVKNKESRELNIDGIFVEIGYEVKTDFVREFAKLNESGEIIVNESCETSYPGIFAAGDITNVPYKQTVIAAGQGAIAGLSAYAYLQKLRGKAASKVDWGEKKI